jgi:hypothetical protein
MLPRAMALVATGVMTTIGLSSLPVRAQDGPASSVQARLPTPIGKIETLTGQVRVEHATGVVVQASSPASGGDYAKRGDPVYEGDIVQTGTDSTVGIAFTDGTAFNLSSGARMVLDQFVYDPNGRSNSTFFNLTKGTFTFVAGKIAKTGDMKIDTPVATMGIRGTAPHVEIGSDGSVKFSTLVEKNKNMLPSATPNTGPGPTNAPAVTRQAKRAPLPGNPAREKAEKDFDQRLSICRGC